ncbi:MAG: hypothetical protein LBV17_03395, partial [Treponema sp.]|nr:hypothetical protein [Treponema sp.]
MGKKLFVIIVCFCLFCCNRKPDQNRDIIVTENTEPDESIAIQEPDENTAIQEADDQAENSTYIDNSVKIEYSDKVHYERKDDWYWTMDRSIDNNIVYISSTEYFNIQKMAIFSLELPEMLDGKKCYYPRPPFSNNKIPVRLDVDNGKYTDWGDELYIYDITNKKLSLIPDVSYWSLFPDADKNYFQFGVNAPEWWLGRTSGWTDALWFIRKDGTIHRVAKDPHPLDYITSEFKGTVFDNEFIMETIRNINETRENIIAMGTNTVRLSENRISQDDNVVVCKIFGRTNAFFYFINRMGIYFDLNIKEIFQIKDNWVYYGDGFYNIIYDCLNVGIYKNGFYIDNEKKLLLLDIKNNKTTLYSFDEELRQYGNKIRIIWN